MEGGREKEGGQGREVGGEERGGCRGEEEGEGDGEGEEEGEGGEGQEGKRDTTFVCSPAKLFYVYFSKRPISVHLYIHIDICYMIFARLFWFISVSIGNSHTHEYSQIGAYFHSQPFTHRHKEGEESLFKTVLHVRHLSHPKKLLIEKVCRFSKMQMPLILAYCENTAGLEIKVTVLVNET